MSHESSFHVIKDPVHGTMQFTNIENNWIKPFIDSPTLQRLRHIKQLGMQDSVFPGAVHTRFNHSIGCCYVASQITKKIKLKENERQLVMIACLLHDIGHGPFSHTFEDIFHDKAIRHETWTPHFLKEYKTKEFFEKYNQINKNFPLDKEKFQLIEDVIMHKANNNKLFEDIVSSQLDADRLDYLLRDNHFCGVTYGEFDFRWMLNSMAVVNTPNGKRLGLTHKGIGVVEQYLMARRLMIRNIYFNQKKLALEFYLIKLLTIVSENIEQPAFKEIKNGRLGEFLKNTHKLNLKLRQGNCSAKLKEDFFKENYENYKDLSDYDIFNLIKFTANMKDNNHAKLIANRIQQRQMPKIIRLENFNIVLAEEMLQEFKKANKDHIANWQINIIKNPNRSYNIEKDPILIINEDKVVQPLDTISFMISALGNKLEHTIFLSIDKEIHNNAEVLAFVKRLVKENHAKKETTSALV